ncbi:MAG: hypothetical protein ACLGIZ_16540 [Acidimicrobiia bacterium]|jgi:hypothetical protein
MTVVNDPGRYRELLNPLLDAVGELVKAVHAAVEDGGVLPGPDAPVLSDIEAESGFSVDGLAPRPVDDAVVLASASIGAGAYHTQALCTLFAADPPVIYTDRVVARAALESSARGWWIAAPINAAERVRRVLNERLHDMSEQLRTAAAMRLDDESLLATLDGRRHSLHQAGVDLGLGAAGRNPRTGDLWVGDQRPGPSAILARFGDALAGAGYVGPRQGEVLQSVYSAYVHATPWALRAPAADDLVAAEPVLGVRRPALTATVGDTASRLGTVAAGLVFAAAVHFRWMGWSLDRLEDARSRTSRNLDGLL